MHVRTEDSEALQDIAVTAVPVTEEVVDHHLKPALQELAPKVEEAAHSITTDVIKPVARDVAEGVEDVAEGLRHDLPRVAEELGDLFMERVRPWDSPYWLLAFARLQVTRSGAC